MERKKTLDIIISFLIAIVLWFYVINIVNPQKEAQVRYVPVNVSGVEALQERGLAVVGDLNYQVNLKIIASRNDISTLTAADFTASTDVASLNKGDDVITVKVAAPRGVTIEDIDSENIEVVVEDFVTEKKPVKINFVDEEEGKEITIKKLEDETIDVSGAKSDVSKVSYVLCELSQKSLKLDDVSTISIPGSPCDASGSKVGGIELSKESVKMEATVYSTKMVKLDAPIQGVPADGELAIENYEIQPVILVKGTTKALDGLTIIKAQPIVIDGITETTTFDIVPILGDGIYKTRNCPPLKATIYISEHVAEEPDVEVDIPTETTGTGESKDGNN